MPSGCMDAVRNDYEILNLVSHELWQFIWHSIWQLSAEMMGCGSQAPLLLCLRRAACLPPLQSLCCRNQPWHGGASAMQQRAMPLRGCWRAPQRLHGWRKATLASGVWHSSRGSQLMAGPLPLWLLSRLAARIFTRQRSMPLICCSL